MSVSMRATAVFLLLLLSPARGENGNPQALADLGPAPDFELVSSHGDTVTLAALRDQVVVVTFIYTWCPDICPLVTSKLADVRDALGDTVGKDVVFVSITFDPLRDTPEVLSDYARLFDANTDGWLFLTGEAEKIRKVTADYGIVTLPGADGAIDHNLLTTLIDQQGRMRVQYAGFRFDSNEMYQDLITLIETQP